MRPTAALCCVFVALLALALETNSAKAESRKPLESSLTGEARKAYDVGLLLYDDGDWAGALRSFDRAFQLSQDSRLMWNMSVCEKNSRHYAKALVLVDNYIGFMKTKSRERDLKDAQAFRDTLEKLTYSLTLDIKPDGATLHVDNESAGVSPFLSPLRFDIGKHELRANKEGYVEQRATISEDDPHELSIILQANQGRLVVNATPAHAEISVDGKVMGKGLYDGRLPSGTAMLRVTAPGMSEHHDTIDLAYGQPCIRDIVLEPRSLSRSTWAWIAASALTAMAIGTTVYFASNPTTDRGPVLEGSWDTVYLQP